MARVQVTSHSPTTCVHPHCHPTTFVQILLQSSFSQKVLRCFVEGEPQTGLDILKIARLSSVEVNLLLPPSTPLPRISVRISLPHKLTTSSRLTFDVPVHCLCFQVGNALCALRRPEVWPPMRVPLLQPKAIGPGSPKGLLKMNVLTQAGLDVVALLLGAPAPVAPVVPPPVGPPPLPAHVDDDALAQGLRLSAASASQDLQVLWSFFLTGITVLNLRPPLIESMPPASVWDRIQCPWTSILDSASPDFVQLHIRV
jgi:hypothetical protein